MAVFTVVMFILLEVALHTLAPVQAGASVDLINASATLSNLTCTVTLEDILSASQEICDKVLYPCPTNSNFGLWGGFCCCSNCTEEEYQLGYFFDEWSNIPHLPRFSEHAGPGTGVGGTEYPTSAIWFFTEFSPTIIGVLYSLLWNIIDVTVKKLHPFMESARTDRQHKSSGSKICFTYLDKNSLLVPFYALWNRDHLVFVVSTLDVVASIILVPLLAGSFQLQMFPVYTVGGTIFARSPAVNQETARAAEAILVCLTVGTAYFTWHMRKRPSAVYSDPTSVATMFAMAHPSILRELRLIDTGSTANQISPSQLDKEFRSLNPRLRHVTDETNGTIRYQFVVDGTPGELVGKQSPPKNPNAFGRNVGKFFSSSIPSLIILLGAIIVLPVLGISFSDNHSSIVYNESSARFDATTIAASAVFLKICWAASERGL